jgi:hypothetical protein
MKCCAAFLSVSLTLLTANAAGTKQTGITVPVKYEGGTLSLSRGKLTATITEDELVFTRGNQKLSVSLTNIRAVTCGIEVRRRSGATVLGVVPRLHLDTAEEHYVGLTLEAGGQMNSGIEAVLKMNGGQYRDFLTTLERLTGRRAVNTGEIPTVVQYGL